MEKGEKIDRLRAKIRMLEADIVEFINEFDKVRQQLSKSTGFLGGGPNQTVKTIGNTTHISMNGGTSENATMSPFKILNIKYSTQLKLSRYQKEQQQNTEKMMKLKTEMNQTISKLDLKKIKEDIEVSSKNHQYLKYQFSSRIKQKLEVRREKGEFDSIK